MVTVIDDEKLFQEMLAKSDKELERIENRVKAARAEKMRMQRKAELEEKAARINAAQESVVSAMHVLFEAGVLPEELKAVYTTSGGSFAPHLKHRPVDTDRLLRLEESAEKPKQKRARKPKAV